MLKIACQLVLLPLLLVALPLMFGIAWVQESISDLSL